MTLIHGDCLDVMAAMEPESVDAIVTDPPYNLTDMGRSLQMPVNLTRKDLGPNKRRTSGGFMGKSWDGTGVAFDPATWAAALRVAKPSAYLLAFGGTRTVHRLATAIEGAGWIIRDLLVWAYASGFPKSKASLKPAWEPIVMARKPGPLRMLAIDECRIPTNDGKSARIGHSDKTSPVHVFGPERMHAEPDGLGRWPANVILTDPIFDGDVDGVVGGGWQSGGGNPATDRQSRAAYGGFTGERDLPERRIPTDSGTYSRFFLIPSSRSDTLSGRMGTCQTCGAPIAEPPSTARTQRPDTAPPSAATPRAERPGQLAFDAASPSPSLETATAPRLAATPRDGTPGSTASEADQGTESDTSGTGPSISPEAQPGTTFPSDQPVRTAEQPLTSTGTTTTTASPLLCERCADDAIHGRTLPPLRPTRPALPPDGDNYPRFYLCPKADRADREPILGGLPHGFAPTMGNGIGAREHDPADRRAYRANVHPTVKPTELMRHLVRLVTPPGGTVLDPFLGSGTTAIAAEMEGFAWIGIEREAEYVAIAEARLNGTQRGLGLGA